MGSGVSSCFFGVHSSYPDDEPNFYTEEKYCGEEEEYTRYFNAVSALFVMWMGFYQLSWDHPYGPIRFLSACVFVNGISSCLNHWYGTRDLYILDNASMYIPAWVMLAAITGSLHDIALDTFPMSELPFCIENNRLNRALLKGILWGIACLFIFFLLYNDMNGCSWGSAGEAIFILGFAAPPIILSFECILFLRYANSIVKQRYSECYGHRFEQSVVYLSWGIALSIIGATMWILLEVVLCDNVSSKAKKWITRIPIHAMWHFLESYAFSLITLFFVSLEALRDQIRIDARLRIVSNDDRLSPDFALKPGKDRIIGTRCCCYLCKCKSRVCDECLSVIFPLPTRVYEDDQGGIWNTQIDVLGRRSISPEDGADEINECCDCCRCIRDLDTTYVTKKDGFCRCWLMLCESIPCCSRCAIDHFPVPKRHEYINPNERTAALDLVVGPHENDEQKGFIESI